MACGLSINLQSQIVNRELFLSRQHILQKLENAFCPKISNPRLKIRRDLYQNFSIWVRKESKRGNSA